MHRAYKSVRAPDGDEFYDRLGQTVNENRGFYWDGQGTSYTSEDDQVLESGMV